MADSAFTGPPGTRPVLKLERQADGSLRVPSLVPNWWKHEARSDPDEGHAPMTD